MIDHRSTVSECNDASIWLSLFSDFVGQKILVDVIIHSWGNRAVSSAIKYKLYEQNPNKNCNEPERRAQFSFWLF